ncbi:MAG TPA: gamma carbonic anhydrase family protein [Rhodospirillaceae bacterium]|nr:gamma carbonic anhydrase family protein [Magnetovibrio sp.]HBT41151.1 gamma carbonic anhydrase family protein [Rhodospirillaceae bacterium]HCS71070.1 gamma carbonic anhydrase family protein [Rhodospirillaceae bacterium]|tara:strand:+ start:866 stop:1453 length:588 start_codon:yes stop_codon:yes gene_type:complete
MISSRQPGGVILPFKDKHPQIDETAFIAENAVIIGDVTIGTKSSIWYSCVLRGDMNFIRIGNDTNIQDGTVVHVDSKGYPTILGDRVTVGHMALLHACTLEDDAMIGMQACVMDGAVVGKGSLIAAGALVTPGKQIGPGEVWAGRPAKFLRKVGPNDQKMLDYIWPVYDDLSAEYRLAGHDLRKLSRNRPIPSSD